METVKTLALTWVVAGVVTKVAIAGAVITALAVGGDFSISWNVGGNNG